VLAERGGLTLVELGRSIVSETGSPSRLVDNLVRLRRTVVGGLMDGYERAA
jgi:hypothetical protein